MLRSPCRQSLLNRSTRLAYLGAERIPFQPQLAKNKRGENIIEKAKVTTGPIRGKRGYVDQQNRIWLRDYAHAGLPDHWDVQNDQGATYFRVDMDGNLIP